VALVCGVLSALALWFGRPVLAAADSPLAGTAHPSDAAAPQSGLGWSQYLGYAVGIVGAGTAVLSFLAAWLRFRNERARHHQEVGRLLDEKNSEIANLHREHEQAMVTAFGEYRTKLDGLVGLLCPQEGVEIVRAVLNVYLADHQLEVCKTCNKLIRALDEDPVPLWFPVLKGAALVLAEKCQKASEPAAEEISFSALGKILAKLAERGQRQDLEAVAEVFERLIAGDVPEHIKTNAIIELTCFCQRSRAASPEFLTRLGSLLAGIIDQLRARPQPWDQHAERQAKSIIASLRVFRGAPHVLHRLLPAVVSLIEAKLATLAETFAKALEALDLPQLDQAVRNSIYGLVEDRWLKSEAAQRDERLRCITIPLIIRLLKPDRPVRSDERSKLSRVVELYLMGGNKVLRGRGIDASREGFCAEIEGMLVGEKFQARRPDEAPFRISEGGEFPVGQVEVRVRDATGTSYAVEGLEAVALRAWRFTDEGTARSCTGLAGRVLAPTLSWERLLAELGSR